MVMKPEEKKKPGPKPKPKNQLAPHKQTDGVKLNFRAGADGKQERAEFTAEQTALGLTGSAYLRVCWEAYRTGQLRRLERLSMACEMTPDEFLTTLERQTAARKEAATQADVEGVKEE
jgi:hypothetical protein